MQRTTVNLVAVALIALAVWFLIAATHESSRVGEKCHPIDGTVWSVLIFMLVSWGMTASAVFFACDGSDSDSNMVALMANANDHDPITGGQCFLAVSVVIFVLFSVPFSAYAASSFFSDPVEPRFIEHYEQSLNTTTAGVNGTIPTIESFENEGSCLVRSRVPGVYLIIAIGFMYVSLGLLTLGKCMWQTRVKRGGWGDGLYDPTGSDDDSDDDFQAFVTKSLGAPSDDFDDPSIDNLDEERSHFRHRGAVACVKCNQPVRDIVCVECVREKDEKK
jgi:hypothetical protein